MNNKQSSVEWLLDNLHLQHSTKWPEIVERAKAMHKEEIENAWWAGCDESLSNHIIHPSEDCNGYYNETFKIK